MPENNVEINQEALTTESEKHDKNYLKELREEVEGSANKKISYKQRYEDATARIEELMETNESLQELVTELQSNAKAINTQADADNSQVELLKSFYNLVAKHIVYDNYTGVYKLEVAFAGPKGKSIIGECKKVFK